MYIKILVCSTLMLAPVVLVTLLYLESGGLQNRYYVVDELKDKRSVKELCTYLEISRSGYYAYMKLGIMSIIRRKYTHRRARTLWNGVFLFC